MKIKRPSNVPTTAVETNNADGSTSWKWGDPTKGEECGTYTVNVPNLGPVHHEPGAVVPIPFRGQES